jgi:hypothetical protein
MVRRRTATPDVPWPEDQFERLDLETWFANGEAFIGRRDLPLGWKLQDLEALWRAHGAECADFEPNPDWWAWQEWGAPGSAG